MRHLCSIFSLFVLSVFSFSVLAQEEEPTYKLIQAEGYALSFEVPLDWKMGQATLPQYDMIMGTSPDSVHQVYYQQYKAERPHQEVFQEVLASMEPRTQTLAQYTRTTFDASEQPQLTYFAKGHGVYEGKLKGFMMGGYEREGKTCIVLILSPPNRLTQSLPVMRHILQL